MEGGDRLKCDEYGNLIFLAISITLTITVVKFHPYLFGVPRRFLTHH